MKLKLQCVVAAFAGVAAMTATVAGASPLARVASSAAPCIPKITTVKGKTQVNYCGPATATVKVGGKSYEFKGGFCTKDAASKISLQLTLGVISELKSPVNGGQPLLQMELLDSPGLTIDTVTADASGKSLETVGTVSVSGSASDGTFKSKGFSSSFSGSWNCHGVIVNIT